MNLIFPDYNNCLTNITNSIMKHFNINTKHPTISKLDRELKKNYQNIVLFLFDGMGSNLLKRNLPTSSFLRKNKVKDIHAVFPPTTTASTTSVLSGLNPSEHGWLGWDMYYKEENIIASMFPNTLKDSDIPASSFSLAEKYFPYTSIIDNINKEYQAYFIAPFGDDCYKDLDDMFLKVRDIIKEDGKKFIYAYSDEPDHSMHHLGTDAKEVIDLFATINNEVAEFCEDMTNTLVIVIADHGHINVEPIIIADYPDLIDTLEEKTWIESRACAFKVKENKKREFEKLFTKYFSNDFILYSKNQVITNKIFGPGSMNPRFSDSIGDYLAIAKSNKYFIYDQNGPLFKSTHAGITEDEVLVPLIIYPSNE